MHRPRRVLLVYALPHSGHSSAAAALQEELELQGLEVEQYNFQEQWNRLGKKAGDMQKWIVEHTPWFWKHVHGNADYAGVTKFVVENLTRWDITGLFAKIEEFKPEVVIATHMLPLRMLGEARTSGHLNIPLLAVTTDLWVHRYWAHLGVDQYFASTKEAKKNLMQYGISPARIQITGIPLRSAFTHQKSLPLRQARKQLGLSFKKPHVTIAGGTHGIFPFQKLLKKLWTERARAASVQWTIIFGNDEKALKKASTYVRKHPLEGVRLLGFTKEIDVYFSASNAVITKPGGLTTCEVVSTGIPLVLCAPIPGQEEGNARLLCETGAAVRQDDPAELVTEVLQLLKNDTQMKALKKAAKQMIPGKSAQRITAAVVAFLDGSPSDRRAR